MDRILIIEDELPISDLIKLNLELAGFDTVQAMDGEEGSIYIKQGGFKLVLLDIMLPKIDGYALLPEIIKNSIPVIVLTAKGSLRDKVSGLNMGADDYMTKPFEGMELVVCVKAVLRRKNSISNKKAFCDIEIETCSRKVFKSGVEIELTMKEYELLEFLVENKGIALSRKKLLECIWDYNYYGNTRTVDMHIQKLRSKLQTENIKTVYKLGYRLEV